MTTAGGDSGAMRVLHVSPFFAPAWVYGGLVEAAYQYTRHLSDGRGDKRAIVRVLTTDANGPASRLDATAMAPYTRGQAFEVRYCARVARQSVSPELARALIEEVRWADVVHLHAAYSFPTIPTMLAARALDRPLVWTPHGALQRWQGSRRPQLKSYWEAVCRAAAPRRMVMHLTSQAERDEARGRFPRATEAMIPNGVEIPEHLSRTPRGDKLRLGFLGRLDPKKGIENLLAACRLLKDRGAVKFSLVIAGAGTPAYEEILRDEIARLGLGSEVTMTGDLRGADKQQMLERCDLAVVPSFTENFGIVVAEALAHGAPVIASTGTPWSEVERRQCGLWVDNRPLTLADAIASASSMALEEMGERGRRWMAERYSWDTCAAELMDLYKSMAAPIRPAEASEPAREIVSSSHPRVIATDDARPRLVVVMYARPDYHPPTLNGVRMMSERFDVSIVCPNDAGPSADWPAAVRIERVGELTTQAEAFGASSAAKLRRFLNFLARLRAEISATAPRVIYAYDPIGFAASIAAQTAWSRKIPVVFHCHDTPDLEGTAPSSLQHWLFRYALRHTCDAALTIFPSKYRAPIWLDKARDSRPPMIIPNGAAREFYRPADSFAALTARRWESKRVLYLGAMGPENGQPQALSALAALANSVTLDLVGLSTAEFRGQLEQSAASLGVQARVSVSAWVPNSERVARAEKAALGLVLYRAVNPNWEHSGPSPNKLFEYAAWGLPVVVPDRKSFREFFADDRWVHYADPDDPASIARAIESIFTDRERYVAMSLAARAAHETKYNYEKLFAPVLARVCALAGVAQDGAEYRQPNPNLEVVS